MLKLAAYRLYADFLMPSRLEAYRALLDHALEAGYSITSLERFWQERARAVAPGARIMVLRHDIDTDPMTAAAMWSIERSRSIGGSYFFRLSTLDIDLMRRIGDEGGEASYHYEELAAIAKSRRIRTQADAIAAIPEARERFRENLTVLRERTGLPMRVVASHGDFVNRALGVANRVVLEDAPFRASVGVDLEAYDDALVRLLTSRHSDSGPPAHWVAEDPITAIGRRDPVVHVLVHPRHWHTRRVINAVDDLRRIGEGLAHRWGRSPRIGRSVAVAGTGARAADAASRVEPGKERP